VPNTCNPPARGLPDTGTSEPAPGGGGEGRGEGGAFHRPSEILRPRRGRGGEGGGYPHPQKSLMATAPVGGYTTEVYVIWTF